MTADIKITNIADILSVAKGSPMEIIFNYLIYQDFPEIPKRSALNEGSEVISSLNLPEKAFLFTHAELANRANKIIEIHNKIGAELTPENFVLGREKLSKLNTEIETFRNTCRDLHSLFQMSINHRLDSEGISRTGDLSVGSDCSIISSPREEVEDDSFGGMGPLGMLLKGNGFSVEMHDCETCPHYDECDMPEKKAR